MDYYVKNNLGRNQLHFVGEPEHCSICDAEAVGLINNRVD